jgi:uncharacterized protein with FMN-binding domain
MKNTLLVLSALIAILAFGFLVSCAPEAETKTEYITGLPDGVYRGSGSGYNSRPVTQGTLPIVLDVVFTGNTVTSYTVVTNGESNGSLDGSTVADHAPVGSIWPTLTGSSPTTGPFIGKTVPIAVANNPPDKGDHVPAAANTAAALLDGVSGATFSWTGFANAINDAYTSGAIVYRGTSGAGGNTGGYNSSTPIVLDVTIASGAVVSYSLVSHGESSGPDGLGGVTARPGVAAVWPTLLTLFNGENLTSLIVTNWASGTDRTNATAQAATDAVSGASRSRVGFSNAIKDALDQAPAAGVKRGSGTGFNTRVQEPGLDIVLDVWIDNGEVTKYEVVRHNESTGTGFGYPGVTPHSKRNDNIANGFETLKTKFNGRTLPLTINGVTITATTAVNAAVQAEALADLGAGTSPVDANSGATYSWIGFARAINAAARQAGITK